MKTKIAISIDAGFFDEMSKIAFIKELGKSALQGGFRNAANISGFGGLMPEQKAKRWNQMSGFEKLRSGVGAFNANVRGQQPTTSLQFGAGTGAPPPVPQY